METSRGSQYEFQIMSFSDLNLQLFMVYMSVTNIQQSRYDLKNK